MDSQFNTAFPGFRSYLNQASNSAEVPARDSYQKWSEQNRDNASVLLFGFGGSQWTRDFAIASLRFVIAVDAKLFVLTLIVGIIVTSAKSWLAAYTNDEASLMTLAGLALVCAYLTKTIPELIGGMISGKSMGGGSASGGMTARKGDRFIFE